MFVYIIRKVCSEFFLSLVNTFFLSVYNKHNENIKNISLLMCLTCTCSGVLDWILFSMVHLNRIKFQVHAKLQKKKVKGFSFSGSFQSLKGLWVEIEKNMSMNYVNSFKVLLCYKIFVRTSSFFQNFSNISKVRSCWTLLIFNKSFKYR